MKSRIYILLILVVIVLSGCSLGGEKIKEISITGYDYIEVGETKPLIVVPDIDIDDLDLIYSSSNPDVLTVDNEGFITGESVGKAIITVSLKEDDNIKDSIEINVIEADIDNIFIAGSSDMYVNSTVKLTIYSNPTHASKNVIWESSDTTVATVDENGVVSGRGMGSVTIKATSVVDLTKTSTHNINVQLGSSNDFEVIGPRVVDLGEELEYSAVYNDIDITTHFTWTSLNPEVATINQFGVLESLSVGETTIRIVNESDSSVFKEFIVRVVAPSLQYKKTNVLSINRDNKNIELLDVTATLIDLETKFLKHVNGRIVDASIDDIYVGMENIYVEYMNNEDRINAILIDGDSGFSNIRVGIRKSITDISDDSTRFHDFVDLTLYNSSVIKTFDNTNRINIQPFTNIRISANNGKMIVTNGTSTIFESSKRIIIVPSTPIEAVKVNSISRGSNGVYSGNLELSLYLNKMLVVNDIDLESYLYKVVPSEMPTSYNAEALKAQAVAARTYAYRDILNRNFERYGYTVDDSVQSQVYNNVNQDSRSNAAVNQTKGLIMMHDGELVNAFYYSTSAGITASAHEVWISDDNVNPDETPYLIGQNHTKDGVGTIIEFDYTNEANMLEFFKLIKVSTPDSSIAFHRWKTTFTKSELTATISKNLTLRYAQTPNLILTKVGDEFVSRPITTNIGSVENIYVGRRGSSGVVISLIIETTTNTYEVINQYNIRFTIRPDDAGVKNERASALSSGYTVGGSHSILFSGFFAIENSNDSFTFYGGGNGHGVGMSQNGANSLGSSGMAYNDILNAYYKDIDLIDITYKYTDLENFRDYFYIES